MRRRKSRPPDLGFTNGCGEGQVRGTPEGCTPWRSMDVFGGPCWWKARASVRWHRSLGSHARPYARCCGIRCRRATGVIDAILQEDRNSPVKQRHTAKRIFDRLGQEYAYTGGYTIVKDYVRLQQVRTREMFVPLTHAPGKAQADFGEAWVI